ncbi:hypothetical protein BCR32DRAFT_292687 [Anaeromyces robustus]|uniref:Uncharacterized protein n=1 Tax=Anaeromyces robustus TaxID=1754192 RepID=A0A1Y1X9G2_9FUNG|nr:hypothetical protein BCR32DRAFT_292687 [Anaeromyces robustus]|eukprot:ORX82375.1 hypothetical protein BCR32DRAFT_292687 [Anaeromyces robustus]
MQEKVRAIEICNVKDFQKLTQDEAKKLKSVTFRNMEINEKFVEKFWELFSSGVDNLTFDQCNLSDDCNFSDLLDGDYQVTSLFFTSCGIELDDVDSILCRDPADSYEQDSVIMEGAGKNDCIIKNPIKTKSSFCKFLWSYSDGKTILYEDHEKGWIPASNGLFYRTDKDLKRHGFKFLSSTTVYSHLQACGIINDHGSGSRQHSSLHNRVGFSCCDIAAYSTDGVNWSQSTLPASPSWNSVCHGNGMFIAVISSGNIAAYTY